MFKWATKRLSVFTKILGLKKSNCESGPQRSRQADEKRVKDFYSKLDPRDAYLMECEDIEAGLKGLGAA